MKPTFRPISLTIVDLFGTFLPGVGWFCIFLLSVELIFENGPGVSFFPINSLQGFLSPFQLGLTWVWSSFFVMSIIFGYIVKPFAMNIAEIMSSIFSIKVLMQLPSKSFKQHLFPYEGLHKETPVFDLVTSIVKEHAQIAHDELPGSQPFSFCKRFLKVVSPELWEETERMEAETRMIGSFFLISAMSTLLSLLFYSFRSLAVGLFLQWFIISTSMTCLLGIGFRKRRLKEVSYTYLNTIVGLAGFNLRKKED